MCNFTELKDDELLQVDGGLSGLEIVGIIAGIYFGIREIVKSAGEAAAYRDLGM